MANASIAGEKKFFVYVHSRLSNGNPFYVGKGRQGRVTTRFGRSAHWNRIVSKDGGRYINVVIETPDEELAFLVEIELIDKYRRMGVELINKTDGGEGMSGYRMTPEQIANQSRAKMGNTANLGRKPSAETLLKMSAWQKGKPKAGLSEDHKRKISESLRGNKRNLGNKASDETRAKLSAMRKGKQFTLGHILTPEHKAKVSAGLKAFYEKRRLENK